MKNIYLMIASVSFLACVCSGGAPNAAYGQSIGDGALDIPGGNKKKPVQKKRKRVIRKKPVERKRRRVINRKRRPDPAVTSRSYDGTYSLVGNKTIDVGGGICLSSYDATIQIKNGYTEHKILFGSLLVGTVRNGTLYITSKNEPNGGKWTGQFRLSKSFRKKIPGYIRFVKNDELCHYVGYVFRQ